MDDDLDPLAADLRLELVGGAAGDDPAVVDDGDLVGELVGLLEVLGRQEQRVALAHLAADHVPEAEAATGVEPGGGLVEEEQARSPDEGRREVEPPPHAARVGLRDAVARVVERELHEQLVGAPARLRAGQLVEPAEHPEVLAPREVLVDRRVLAGEADQLAHAPARRARRRGLRRSRGRRPPSAGSRGCGPSWSSRRRSGRGGRAPCPPAPPGRRRRARGPRASAIGRP